MSFPVDMVTLLTFIPAALALNLTPGADMMFCLGQGMRGGWRAAIAADFGIALGGLVHMTLAGLGLAQRWGQFPLAARVWRKRPETVETPVPERIGDL